MGGGEVGNCDPLTFGGRFLQHFGGLCEADILEPVSVDGQDLVSDSDSAVFPNSSFDRLD